MALGFLVLGTIPVSMLFIIEKVREMFPLNEVLISLSVITVILAVVAVIIGYKTVKQSAKVSIILLSIAGGIIVLDIILLIASRVAKRKLIAVILSGIFLAFAVLIVLYLTGQGLKRCNNQTTKTLLPIWLAMITWAGCVYLFISIAVMFIEGKTMTS
uniref:Uncharacterized protein n=1 Tax=Trichobilharzia regenti TaxID=157069 RepID=A0AA85IXU9_TRIRE|nr:unnamed protein product [Trichobilharzia regenti]